MSEIVAEDDFKPGKSGPYEAPSASMLTEILDYRNHPNINVYPEPPTEDISDTLRVLSFVIYGVTANYNKRLESLIDEAVVQNHDTKWESFEGGRLQPELIMPVELSLSLRQMNLMVPQFDIGKLKDLEASRGGIYQKLLASGRTRSEALILTYRLPGLLVPVGHPDDVRKSLPVPPQALYYDTRDIPRDIPSIARLCGIRLTRLNDPHDHDADFFYVWSVNSANYHS